MNYLTALCLCVAAVQAQLTSEQVQLLASHSAKCLEQSKADPIQVQNLKNGEFQNVNVPLKQYTLCLMMESGLIDADGVLNKDVALAKTFVPEDKPKVDEVFTNCEELSSGQPEDIAWTFAVCFFQNYQKYSIFQ